MPAGILRLLAARPEGGAIHAAQNDQQRAPPDWRMQFSQHGIGRMRPFRQPAGENQDAVHRKQHANKKPNRNDVMFFAHKITRK
jgi:hypothetical protein